MRILKSIDFLDVILVLLATLFIYAALNKLMTFQEFVAQISKSPYITKQVWWISWSIPSIELVIAGMLLIPRLQLIALFASFSLMYMFSGYIFLVLTFSPYVPCSCGGILNGMGWTSHLIFNIGFTLLAVAGIILYNRRNRQSFTVEPAF